MAIFTIMNEIKNQGLITGKGRRDVNEENSLSSFPFKLIVTTLLTYFGFRLFYFAATISPFVPPDEVTHFGKCVVFSKYFLFPDNFPDSYQYGLVTNIPWLYYWVMGKLLCINIFGMSDLIFLRLLNIPLAFGTIYFIWRLLRLTTDDRLTQVLLIVAMTNTLMFSFISATVSYDNLTNLLAAMAIYYLFSFFKNRSGNQLGTSLLCQMAGCLTKLTFLPLALGLVIILLVHEIRHVRDVPAALKTYFRASDGRRLTLLVFIFLALALNIQLYGGNYLRFRHLEANMRDLLPFEIAMQYRIEARDTIFSLFKEGRISLNDARQMASQYISHEDDRRGTIFLVENHAMRESRGEPLLGPLAYVSPWGLCMLGSVYGIMGHESMINQGTTLLPILALMVLSGIAVLVRFRPGEEARLPMYLAIIALFYTIFLMYAVNYRIYLEYESVGVALQGRYIFPVIGPIYVLSCSYLLHLFKGRPARLGISIASALILIASDFPYFLYHVTSQWFMWTL